MVLTRSAVELASDVAAELVAAAVSDMSLVVGGVVLAALVVATSVCEGLVRAMTVELAPVSSADAAANSWGISAPG
jgi:hypothetical protein